PIISCRKRESLDASFRDAMSLAAVGLLFFAGICHAGWNLLVKQADGDRFIFTWWGLVASAIGVLPLVIVGEPLPREIWPYVITSALVETVYFVTLVSAYGKGDFSLVYPIARGTAPAFLALWAALFLGESLQAAGAAGLASVVVGLVVIGSSAWWDRDENQRISTTSLWLALFVALCISIYSAIDGAAVQSVSPLSYYLTVISLTALFVTPVLLVRSGWSSLLAEGRASWKPIALVGILGLVSYTLVLAAYQLAPVSYAGAVREVSVVFAALMGWLWLGERLGAIRVVGALVIFGGILLIAGTG
ncbi:MAG: EamA family transporter, partial [Ardenticatenaceae bacterium]